MFAKIIYVFVANGRKIRLDARHRGKLLLKRRDLLERFMQFDIAAIYAAFYRKYVSQEIMTQLR